MINLIPLPEKIKQQKDIFSFEKKNATVCFSPQLSEIKKIVSVVLGCDFKETEGSAVLNFVFDKSKEKEAYSLTVNKNGIEVLASGYEGAFYALQTVRQLFETDLKNKKVLSAPFTEIENDSPRYEWRGLQLDESRHFFGKETVKKLLDFMAMYKLNVFHWHLTDDQGWRIEIKKYPLLTEIGSKRNASQLGNWNCLDMDYTSHEGFYTQEDIKEIVAYAKERCIEIVPEIDFPAHSAAALAAYNNLACRNIPCEVLTYFGEAVPFSKGIRDWNRTLCLGKDEVYSFVFDVIDEVAALFPFEYFHVGGDEAPRNEWKKCPLCQKKIKDENLKNEDELQGFFTNKLNEHLKTLGKTLIGWNEILSAKGLDRDVVAQYWTLKKDPNVTKHLKKGGKIIMSCHNSFYFDMPHTQAKVRNTYYFNPLKHNVPEAYMREVLGLEGENWTEWTDCENELFFKLSVRTLALAESAWSTEKSKSFKDFCRRLQRHKFYFDALGIYYGHDEFTVNASVLKKTKKAKSLGISVKNYDAEYEMDKLKRKK